MMGYFASTTSPEPLHLLCIFIGYALSSFSGTCLIRSLGRPLAILYCLARWAYWVIGWCYVPHTTFFSNYGALMHYNYSICTL